LGVGLAKEEEKGVVSTTENKAAGGGELGEEYIKPKGAFILDRSRFPLTGQGFVRSNWMKSHLSTLFLVLGNFYPF